MARKLIARKSGLHGFGLFAARDLPSGERLIEYKGVLYAEGEVPFIETDGLTRFLGLSDGTGIDGRGWAALANHGCEPNCELREEAGRTRIRAWLYALRDIKQGEEVLWDYRLVVTSRKEAASTWACACGAKTCRGTMANPDNFRTSRKQGGQPR